MKAQVGIMYVPRYLAINMDCAQYRVPMEVIKRALMGQMGASNAPYPTTSRLWQLLVEEHQGFCMSRELATFVKTL